MQCLLEEVLNIIMVTIYPNKGHMLTMIFRNKSSQYSHNQQLSLFSLKLAICISLFQEVLIYHNGYHIPKLWAYVNHGIFLAIINQVTA